MKPDNSKSRTLKQFLPARLIRMPSRLSLSFGSSFPRATKGREIRDGLCHRVDAVITARKEHVARCDRSGDQGGKAVVDRFRGAIADHQPHTLSSPAKACSDRQESYGRFLLSRSSRVSVSSMGCRPAS